MEYMILNHTEETEDGPAPGSPEFGAMMGSWMAYNQMLIDGGHWISGASLTPTAAATTLRKSGGKSTVVDGPHAATKEQIGGYYLIEAKDLDQALELAGQMPVEEGSLEVRPIALRPDAQYPASASTA